MNQSQQIENQNFFEDVELKSNKNITLLVLRSILLVFAFVAIMGLLFDLNNAILAQKMLPLRKLFQIENPTELTSSFLVVFRFLLLFITFIYTLYINYANLKRYQHNLILYLPLFVTYALLSLVSVILLFTYFDPNPAKILILAYILIPMFLTRVWDFIFRYFLGKKTDPLLNRRPTILIISILSRLVTYSLLLFVFLYWPTQSSNGSLFSEIEPNSFYNLIRGWFVDKTATNLIIVSAFFILFGLLLFANNINLIVLAINKRIKINTFQYYIELSLVIFAGISIWFVRSLFYKLYADNLLEGPSQNSLLYLVSILFLAIILGLYCAFAFLFKSDGRKNNLQLLGLVIANSLLMATYIFVSLLNSDTLTNIIIFGFTTLFIFISNIIFWQRVKRLSVNAAIFIIGNAIILGLNLAINGINQLFLTQEISNWLFYTIFPPFSLMQMVSLAYLTFVLLNAIYITIAITVSFSKLVIYTKLKAKE